MKVPYNPWLRELILKDNMIYFIIGSIILFVYWSARYNGDFSRQGDRDAEFPEYFGSSQIFLACVYTTGTWKTIVNSAQLICAKGCRVRALFIRKKFKRKLSFRQKSGFLIRNRVLSLLPAIPLLLPRISWLLYSAAPLIAATVFEVQLAIGLFAMFDEVDVLYL